MLTDKKIQEIIDATDIVSLVGETVDLIKKGSGYFGLCPFHSDSSPSFSVSPDKKIAKCMSCGEGGNPITFLRKLKNISFNEAVVILADRANIKVDLNVKPKKEDKNKKYYDIYKVAQEFYSYNLFNSKSGKLALKYLYERGLTEETIKMFKIGLAPSEKDTLKNVLLDKGFIDIDCIEIGLIKNNDTILYDMFVNRIMFPITNENNQTIAFSGRLFDSSNGPKYVNTMETIIYRKGDHLYNLSNAYLEINKTKRIVLCEGQMDVIKIYNSGIKDVVCALGSALTTNQVKLIKKYATSVVLAYDNDNAGVKATKTAINLLKGLNIDVLELPNGIDPDEFIRKNSNEKFLELFSKKVNHIEFIYKSFFKDKNIYDLVDAEQIKNQTFDFIKTLSSNTIKEQLFIKLSNDLKISYESLLKDYNIFNGIKEKPQKTSNDKGYQMRSYNEPVFDYIPEAPPADFGAPPIYDNKHQVNINVEIKPTIKKIMKGLEEACATLIAILISDKEYFIKIQELIDDDIELFLPKEYSNIYSHLSYLYNTYDIYGVMDIVKHFNSDNLANDDFKKIIDTINDDRFVKTKYNLLINDSILFIKENYFIKQLKNSTPIEVKSEIDLYNANLLKAKELDKIRVKKIKNK